MTEFLATLIRGLVTTGLFATVRFLEKIDEGGDFLMKLRDQAIRKLDELRPEALARVYDLIMEIERADQAKERKATTADYIKVRKALNQCKGSLSDDIIQEREERI